MPKVKINPDACVGCGMCASTAPEIFEIGPEGKAQIVSQYRVGGNPHEGEIPEDLRSSAEAARDSCPQGAITVE